MIKFNLKQVMKEKNKTLKELSDMTGLSINTLSLLSTGKSKGIQFDTLEKLIKALECNLNDLIIMDSEYRKLKFTEFSVTKHGIFTLNKLENYRIFNVFCSFVEEGTGEENSLMLTVFFEDENVEITVSGIMPIDFLKSGKFFIKPTYAGKTKEYIILDFQLILHILKKGYKKSAEFRQMFNFNKQSFSINLLPYNSGLITFKRKNEEEFLSKEYIPAFDHLKNLVSFDDDEIKLFFNFYTEEELSEDEVY